MTDYIWYGSVSAVVGDHLVVYVVPGCVSVCEFGNSFVVRVVT